MLGAFKFWVLVPPAIPPKPTLVMGVLIASTVRSEGGSLGDAQVEGCAWLQAETPDIESWDIGGAVPLEALRAVTEGSSRVACTSCILHHCVQPACDLKINSGHV